MPFSLPPMPLESPYCRPSAKTRSISAKIGVVGYEHRRRVLSLLWGYRSARVLIACAELGVFEAIGNSAVPADELARRTGTEVAALARLLNAAVALGLLERRPGGYANGPAALACLAREGDFYLGNLARREGVFYRRWARLTDAVRQGTRPPENVQDEPDPAWIRGFELALYDLARTSAPAVVNALRPFIPPDRPVRVIDVGGGHGAYSIALALRHPNLEAVVFDLPRVTEVAAELIERSGVAGRVRVRAGDFKVDALGNAEFDLALLFGVLVAEDEAEINHLLRKAFAALRPGGVVAVREPFLDEDGSGPLDAVLFDLHMLVSTDLGRAHTASEVRAWLEKAGFSGAELVEAAGPEAVRLVVARRPA